MWGFLRLVQNHLLFTGIGYYWKPDLKRAGLSRDTKSPAAKVNNSANYCKSFAIMFLKVQTNIKRI